MSYSLEKLGMERIERLLGRSITNDREILESYQSMSPAFLRDLTSLVTGGGTIDAVSYLLFGLGGRGGLSNALSYVENVVKGGMSQDEWLCDYYRDV